MAESDVQRRNQLDTELRAVQSALKFYHEALETERRLTNQPVLVVSERTE